MKYPRKEKEKQDKPQFKKQYEKKPGAQRKFRKKESSSEDNGLIRLNKYIANSGICSRREADELIASGAVSVNGKIVTQLGTKISPEDHIQFGGETLRKEKPVYLLLNKPKDYITTTDDPEGRKTVMALIKNACKERVYPVGRLDRATSGLLLFTNDGEMAKKLMHPRHGVKKIYHVELDKNLTKVDLDKIATGLELEDGIATVDEIAFDGNGSDKKCIGLEIHTGKNRIVRRIFETLGYQVVKLDRVIYAGLTKKDLPRGRWRFLTQMEISMLKMIS
jgi:23S rRNA pseudouridine2605 synthase